MSISIPNLKQSIRHTAKNPKSKMAAAAILNFEKSVIFRIIALAWQMSICTENLVENGQMFMYFQDGGRRPSWNYLSPILEPTTSLLVG